MTENNIVIEDNRTEDEKNKELQYKKEIEDLKRLNLAFEKGLNRRCAEFAVFHAEKHMRENPYEPEGREDAFKTALEAVIDENSFLKGIGIKTGLKQEAPVIDRRKEMEQTLAEIMGVRML